MKKFLLTFFLALTFVLNANASSIMSYKYNDNTIVLMYHKLSENPAEWSDFCTSPQVFESDIALLKKNGYVFKTASELASKKPDTSQKTVVITFDDGYASDYKYALPILEKYNAKATFFVVGSFVGTNDYLDENMLKKLSISEFAEIGNHSYEIHKKNYNEITFMLKNGKHNEFIADFEKNAEYLKKVTEKDIKVLSFPYGLYSESVNIALRKNNLITFSTDSSKFIYQSQRAVGRKNRSHYSIFKEFVR